jgi:hypothetical protein
VGSAALTAVTVAVPILLGAVYIPEEVMLPVEAFQVTALFVEEPSTVAAKGTVPLVMDVAEPGETVTEVTAGLASAAVILIVAEADLVGSAALVAVTTPDPGLEGAVKSPDAAMLPTEADHLTPAVLPAP